MSQEYTPVTWQDETTSQQGTLINAARLDQMQTAHHYADGWREVDAVPTADPGVDYHQVVYCTADSTFYRWNGSAWTKDIDDVTKAELDAEIERATLAEGALDSAKADKATTLAGYGITDAYTKAQTDTLLAGKMDDGDAYTKAEADTLLAGKADVSALTDGSVTKVGTADVGGDLYPIKLVAGVPTAVANALVDTATAQTINANKGFTNNASTTSSSATVKGYFGVSNIDMGSSFSGNRYAFKDCLVDGNGAIIAGTRIHAASATQSVIMALVSTKSDGTTKALKELARYDRTNDAWEPTMANDALDAYPTMVRTANAQTIAGVKTFTDNLEVSKNTPLINIGIKNYTRGTAPGSSIFNGVRFIDSASANVGGFRLVNDTDGNRAMMEIYNNSGSNTSLAVFYKDNGNSYATAPARAYNTANTSDVVTIGSLKASTDVVHTSGAETIEGTKTFYDAGYSRVKIKTGRTGATDNIGSLAFYDSTDTQIMNIQPRNDGITNINLFGTTKALLCADQRAYNAANTADVATISTLDNYTSMVRTTGNQDIAGVKKFTSGIARSGGDVHNLIEDTTSKDITSGTVWYGGRIRYYDTNGVEIGRIFIRANANATSTLGIEVRNSDGTFKFISLGTGDVIS